MPTGYAIASAAGAKAICTFLSKDAYAAFTLSIKLTFIFDPFYGFVSLPACSCKRAISVESSHPRG